RLVDDGGTAPGGGQRDCAPTRQTHILTAQDLKECVVGPGAQRDRAGIGNASRDYQTRVAADDEAVAIVDGEAADCDRSIESDLGRDSVAVVYTDVDAAAIRYNRGTPLRRVAPTTRSAEPAGGRP